MPTLDELTLLVRETFGQTQDSLGKLEVAAQSEDRPEFHRLAQAYARLLSPLRDYVTSVNMGRPLPRQLAKRISEPVDPIFELPHEVQELGLHPDGDALTRLVQMAESVT